MSLLTRYLSVQDLVDLVRRKGLSACLAGVAARIEAEFLRWEQFEKSARLAFHSADGVVELMPIADDRTFTFKYVNGHPKNTAAGLSDAIDGLGKLFGGPGTLGMGPVFNEDTYAKAKPLFQ